MSQEKKSQVSSVSSSGFRQVQDEGTQPSPAAQEGRVTLQTQWIEQIVDRVVFGKYDYSNMPFLLAYSALGILLITKYINT